MKQNPPLYYLPCSFFLVTFFCTKKYQTSQSAGPAVASSSSPLDVQFVTSSGPSSCSSTRKSSGKSRIILVQNKPGDLQVAQSLANLPATTMTAQDLQRTLGLKLEDLQAQGIIGLQQGATARAIKLEDITGANVQISAAQTVGNQQVSRKSRKYFRFAS